MTKNEEKIIAFKKYEPSFKINYGTVENYKNPDCIFIEFSSKISQSTLSKGRNFNKFLVNFKKNLYDEIKILLKSKISSDWPFKNNNFIVTVETSDNPYMVKNKSKLNFEITLYTNKGNSLPLIDNNNFSLEKYIHHLIDDITNINLLKDNKVVIT